MVLLYWMHIAQPRTQHNPKYYNNKMSPCSAKQVKYKVPWTKMAVQCNGSEISRNTADYFQSGLDCCSLRDRDTVQYSWCLWVGCIANKSERWAVMLTLANPDASPGKSLQRCESRSCYPHTPALHPSTLHPGPVRTASVFHPRVTCGPCFALASPNATPRATVTYCTFGKTLKLANCLVCALLNFPFAL